MRLFAIYVNVFVFSHLLKDTKEKYKIFLLFNLLHFFWISVLLLGLFVLNYAVMCFCESSLVNFIISSSLLTSHTCMPCGLHAVFFFFFNYCSLCIQVCMLCIFYLKFQCPDASFISAYFVYLNQCTMMLHFPKWDRIKVSRGLIYI